jgi:hypothetical protein
MKLTSKLEIEGMQPCQLEELVEETRVWRSCRQEEVNVVVFG